MPRQAASMRDAFLQSILESPDDDMPRLVFADWLEEQGDPRGTYIRLQCERARLTRFDPGWAELLAQESKLYRQFEPDWSKPISRLVDELEYRRGFVEHVRVSAAKFLKNADRLFRLAPISSIRVERVQGSSMSQVMDKLGASRVRELDLSHNVLGNRTLEMVVEADACRALRSLRLCRCGLRETNVQILLAAPHLESLQSLHLSDNDFGREGTQMLAGPSHWTHLRELNLHRNNLYDVGAIALANSTTMRLNKLALGANFIGNDAAANIAASRCFADLRSLDLEHNHVSNVGIEALVNSPTLERLEYLNLASNRISSKGVQLLTESRLLANLSYLNLKHNDIDKATAQTIPQRLSTPKMRELLY